MNPFRIRPLVQDDRRWVAEFLTQHWGSAIIVTRGKIHSADYLLGFVAEQESQPVGLVTCHMDGDDCEIVSLNSLTEQMGIGSAFDRAIQS